MQVTYLSITLGFQLFILVGLLFYGVFRTYSVGEDRLALISWIAGLIGTLILGLFVSLFLISPRMISSEAILTTLLSYMDLLVMILLCIDIIRQKKSSEING